MRCGICGMPTGVLLCAVAVYTLRPMPFFAHALMLYMHTTCWALALVLERACWTIQAWDRWCAEQCPKGLRCKERTRRAVVQQGSQWIFDVHVVLPPAGRSSWRGSWRA